MLTLSEFMPYESMSRGRESKGPSPSTSVAFRMTLYEILDAVITIQDAYHKQGAIAFMLAHVNLEQTQMGLTL